MKNLFLILILLISFSVYGGNGKKNKDKTKYITSGCGTGNGRVIPQQWGNDKLVSTFEPRGQRKGRNLYHSHYNVSKAGRKSHTKMAKRFKKRKR